MMALGFSFCVMAQSSIDTASVPYDELAKINATTYYSDHISFDAKFSYTFPDTSGSLSTDTLMGTYKLNMDNYYMLMDSVLVIQNAEYRATIQYRDQVMTVEKPINTFKSILQLNVLDSTFQTTHLSGWTYQDTSSYRKLIAQFKSESMFSKYEMLYDTSTYYPIQVNIQVKNYRYDEKAGEFIDSYSTIIVRYSNFQTGAFTDSVFSTDTYFKREDGLFKPLSPFSSYEIIDSYNQE